MCIVGMCNRKIIEKEKKHNEYREQNRRERKKNKDCSNRKI